MLKDNIAVVAFNGISPLHLSVPCAVFGEDRRGAGVPQFKVVVCGVERGTLATSAGFSLTGLHGLGELEKAGIIIVPSWHDPNELPPQHLLRALRKAAERGATLVGLCLGSYVLAAAGLLDGRRATTHWAWADDLASRYPSIHVDRDVLYVDEGKIITSAGGAAGIDCCLHILRNIHGAEVASRVARHLVVPPHRQGGQAQYIEQPLQSTATVDRFAQALEWVQQNLDQPHSLDALAARVFMSRRTFTRRFRQATGATVGKWLLNQRLALAQRLLETTGKPVDQIAQQAGFGSEVSLRLHFNKILKISPARYRKEFRGG
ncbi:GlxA family transcriptional regulator [Geotalea toluenoxydans]|uniref:GlxA family transcriptional regulator n=1 Tax=Geotalea toluenoxydans TaxID=421624 RepID=UPI0006D0CA4A|nr:helix-turn-helix domain-containing protein [Geotalea toluenoxydans]